MLTLFHHPLSPASRYVRLILTEYGVPVRRIQERFWDRREEFLLLNPAGEVPVTVADGPPPAAGAGGAHPRRVHRGDAAAVGASRAADAAEADPARRGAPAGQLVQRQVPG